MTHRTTPRRQRGFNLVEAAIVLGVVGLVIGGIWTAAAAVNRNMKLNDLTQAISIMHNNLSAVYQSNRPANNTYTIIEGPLLREVTPRNLSITTSSDAYVNEPMGGTLGVNVSDGFMVFRLAADNFTPYCIEVANKLNTVFRRLSPTAFMQQTFGTDGNVIGAANDTNLSSPEQASANCSSEDGLLLYLSY